MATPEPGKARIGLAPGLWRPLSDLFAVLMTLTAIGWALSFQI